MLIQLLFGCYAEIYSVSDCRNLPGCRRLIMDLVCFCSAALELLTFPRAPVQLHPHTHHPHDLAVGYEADAAGDHRGVKVVLHRLVHVLVPGQNLTTFPDYHSAARHKIAAIQGTRVSRRAVLF